MQVWGTCLGHQLQMILTANADFNDLLITTDAVVSPQDKSVCLLSALLPVTSNYTPMLPVVKRTQCMLCGMQVLINWLFNVDMLAL